ncbi:MAG: hypothetical protein ACE37H_08115 [Phycisphaeraceae bacterium]
MDPYDEYDFDPPDEQALDALDALGDAAGDVDQATPHVKPHNLRADAGVVLETDLDCIHCGYNLRGQRTDGHCSECGTPIAHSMRSDLLKFADTRWLRGLKQGVMWVLIGAFTGIGLGIVAGVAEAAFEMKAASSSLNQQNPFAPPRTPMLVVLINFIAVLVPNAMSGFGYWRLTEPEPPPNKPRVTRPLARWTILPAYAVSVLGALLLVGRNNATDMASAGMDLVAAVLAVTGFVASMLYLRLLAIRSQDRGLAKQTSIVLWGMIAVGVAFVLGVVLFAVIAGLASPSPNNMLGLLFVVGCPLLLALLTFLIWWVVLMFFYQSRFTKMINLSIKHHRAAREQVVA